MLAEEQNDGRHDIGKGDFELLDELAEIHEVELWHHNELETRIQTLVNQAREACGMSAQDTVSISRRTWPKKRQDVKMLRGYPGWSKLRDGLTIDMKKG